MPNLKKIKLKNAMSLQDVGNHGFPQIAFLYLLFVNCHDFFEKKQWRVFVLPSSWFGVQSFLSLCHPRLESPVYPAI